MIRLILLATIVAVSLVLGAALKQGLKLKADTLSALTEDISSVETALKLERASAVTILEALADRGRLNEFWKEMIEKISSGAEISDAWKTCENALTADDETKAALGAFMSEFGSGDMETEKTRLALLTSKLDEKDKKMRAELEKNMTLAGALPVFIGLAVAIMLI